MELHHPVNELFAHLDGTPVGTASLAQVHRAFLRDGTCVAVKVQHKLVRAYALRDVGTMMFLVRCVRWLFPSFELMWLAEATKRNLPVELDFYNEGKNAERLAQELHSTHANLVKIPKVPGIIFYYNHP